MPKTAATPTESIEVVFSFDTTGSMYPCLTQVRRSVQQTITRLFNEIPSLRVGVIAHGDYCDGPRMISKFELSSDVARICRFVQTVESTSGGDAPEAYEAVLHEARSLNWTHGKSKVLVMIGDEVPHSATERQNVNHYDWKNECNNLREMGVQVYGVQCLNRRHATSFYRDISEKTAGFHLSLDQFANITDLIFAVCYQQAGPEQLQRFEEEVTTGRRMNRNMDRVFSTLSGRRTASRFTPEGDLRAVPPGRFQVLTVDRDMPIKDFCTAQGVEFKTGRGFYELTKPVTVQGTKEIVLMHRESGDLFTGARARELLGLPLHDEDVKLRPVSLETYIPFIQSTSNNRKLIGSTRLLYEVPDWDSSAA